MFKISSLGAVVALALVAAAGCGVLADDTAATVLGHRITIEDVNELARDEDFVGSTDGITDSTMDGQVFRSMLQFEVERVAWVAEAERWGLDLNAGELAEARDFVEQQMAAENRTFAESTVDRYVEYVAAQTLLMTRFSELDPADDADLRTLFDGAPQLFDRFCVAAVGLLAEDRDAVMAEIESGTPIEELPEAVEGTGLVADPETGCQAAHELPQVLVDEFRAAPLGEPTGPVAIDDGQGGQVHYVFRVDDLQSATFEDARDEVAGIAEILAERGPSAWVSLLAGGAEIDPRFGSGVTAGTDGLTVLAPPRPLTVTTEVADLFGGIDGATP